MSRLREAVTSLQEEARTTNERRLLVLTGDREACYNAARQAMSTAVSDEETVTVVGEYDILPAERIPPERAGSLLGTTRGCVAVDCHDACRPNALGRAVGAVDGGGILLLLVPPLDEWHDRRDDFDEGLAVPPFPVDEVAGNFRCRLGSTLRSHRGIAIVDADTGEVERNGLTDSAPRLKTREASLPADYDFPREAYEACLTADQRDVLEGLEVLRGRGNGVVVEADRGRGKSSAAGLAAGSLAVQGRDVLVTAPSFRNAREVFSRAEELLETLDILSDTADHEGRTLEVRDGGQVRFASPPTAGDLLGDPDIVIVDEAAALPVRTLEGFIDAPNVVFCTTVHGYEGTGRGFSVRFRDRLTASDLTVTDVSMTDPIRYAAGDPIEVWAFRALLLDARPAVDELVVDTSTADARYVRLAPTELLADEHRLREAFGLLVLAHYRTEPDDLARLLDAPNVAIRALVSDGRITAVALLAREGGLSGDRARGVYEGERIRGNMIPDILLSQLRDPDAGAPVGVRVMRIATHPAVRSRGLGSKLLASIRQEFSAGKNVSGGVPGNEPGWTDPVDWLGVGFGATPQLLRFWRQNSYHTIHISTTRNEASGEYSALMLDPRTPSGQALATRSSEWFRRRIGAVLTDALTDVDPDIVREALRATDGPAFEGESAGLASVGDRGLTDREWRVVAAAAYGPGLFDVAPAPFRRVVLRHLIDGEADLEPRSERLLVRKALQARSWSTVATELGFVSRRECKRAFGQACRPLVETYGSEAATDEADRYR